MILLIWQWYEWMKPCACSFFFTQIVLTRWGCFIAGMSFACLDPPHHAHHVGSPVLTFFHIIQKAQFFRSGWSRPSAWLLGWSATGLGCLWKTPAMLNITSKLAPVAFSNSVSCRNLLHRHRGLFDSIAAALVPRCLLERLQNLSSKCWWMSLNQFQKGL